MAKAATLTIVEAEEIVPVGSIDPNDVDLPGIFVDRIVPATAEKHIEIRKLRSTEGTSTKETPEVKQRNRIAKRAAQELKEGYYVNLGVGIPTLTTSFLPEGRTVWVQSENGILGMGPYPTEEEVDPYVYRSSYHSDLALLTTPMPLQGYHQRRKRDGDSGTRSFDF